MKLRFAALAAALVVSSVGCSAMRSCGPCGDMPCHVATSQNAPRASGLMGRCPTRHGLFDRLGWTQKGCCECVGDSCGAGCGMFGAGGGDCGGCGCGNCDNCLQNGISCLIDCPGQNNCRSAYGCNNGCGGPGGCNGNGACGLGGCGNPYGAHGCGDQNYNFNAGPPVGQVAYPYYTTRGPRDFLMCNPPSIGPR